MRHARTLLLLTVCLALSACASAQQITIEDQAKQQAAQTAQLVQQSKTAMAACDSEIPAGDPKTAVARRKCINDGFAIRLPTFWPDQDLVRGVLADSMIIAESVQVGRMTIAEGNAAIAQKWSDAVTASQKRANSKNTPLTREGAAAGQQSSAGSAADSAAVIPVDLPGFTCVQNGSVATCN